MRTNQGNKSNPGQSQITTSVGEGVETLELSGTAAGNETRHSCTGNPRRHVAKKPPAKAGDAKDAGSIPGSGRSPGEGNGNPLQLFGLGNPKDGEAWWAAVHWVAKSQTRLSDFTFTCHFHALEKEMATHSSVLAWRIPGTGEPDGLLSVGSHRVRHD